MTRKSILQLALLALFGFIFVLPAQADTAAAKRHMARGVAALEMAKSPADFRDAVEEFSQAVKQAPEWADAWYNLGVAQESAEDYRAAIESFKGYLKKSPKAADREAVETRIYKLEYKLEKAGKIAGKQEMLTSLSGKWEVQQWDNWKEKPSRYGKWTPKNGPSKKWLYKWMADVEVRGQDIEIALSLDMGDKYWPRRLVFRGTFNGGKITGKMQGDVPGMSSGVSCPASGTEVPFEGTVWLDDKVIMLETPATYYWGGMNGAECNYIHSYVYSFLLDR